MSLQCVELQKAGRGTDPRTTDPRQSLTSPNPLHPCCTRRVLSKLTVLSGPRMATDTEHLVPIRGQEQLLLRG